MSIGNFFMRFVYICIYFVISFQMFHFVFEDNQSRFVQNMQILQISKSRQFLGQAAVNIAMCVLLHLVMLAVCAAEMRFYQLCIPELYLVLFMQAVQQALWVQILARLIPNKTVATITLSLACVFQFLFSAVLYIPFDKSCLVTVLLPIAYHHLLRCLGSNLTFDVSWCFIAIIPTVVEFALLQLTIFVLEYRVNHHEVSKDVSIKATGISLSYKQNRVLDDLNLYHAKAEMLCLLGNNGCGKTTFVKCVLNNLWHKGHITKSDQIKIIPQEDIYFSGLTLQQHLSVFGIKDLSAMRVLGVEQCLRQKYEQLSGGQKRRFTIAFVLAFNPKVLILDEISVGSDCNVMQNIWSEIMKVNQTQIIITHNMNEAKQYSNRMVLMQHGKAHDISELQKRYLVVVYQKYIEGF